MKAGETPKGLGHRRRSGQHACSASVRPTPGLRIQADALSTRALLAFADALKRYHRHRVLHLERVESLFDDGRRLHQQVWRECQKFLDNAVANRDRHTDLLDRGVPGLQNPLHRLGT